MATAIADASDVRRARAADSAVVPWDDVMEAAVTTAAGLAERSGYRPDHHAYLAGFFGRMAQAPSAAGGAARSAPRRKSAERRKAAVDLGVRLARRVDDPASTLTSGVDGLGRALDAARRLAIGGREPEAWCVLAGFTSSIGDRIAEIHVRAAPIATERAALAHEFALRQREPQSVGDSRGDALGL